MRSPAPWLVASALVCSASMVCAQPVQVETKVSERTVELGQSLQVQLTATVGSDQPAPSSPRLPAPPGAEVYGPSVSSQQQVVMRGATIERRHGLTATWSVTPKQVGKLHIAAPSVVVGSKQHQGQPVTITVVPRGQGPRSSQPQRGFPSDPFDFLRRGRGSLFPPGLLDDPFDALDDDRPFIPDYPREYAVDHAPDPVAFLRSKLDKKSAVVGEQVTLSIYAYGKYGPIRETNSNEPQAADFLTFPVVENSGHERQFQVDIGDDIWHAVKVRELALFPIRTGNLSVGKMRMGFAGRGYRPHGNQAFLTRTSELLKVTVQEPPLAGRPPGYRMGDVGRYELKASVTPRETRQGDAVAVSVSLSGTGNLPMKLDVPEQDGVEWLEPQVTGEVNPQGSVVQGSRQFQYVVRLSKAGLIDLGELKLPHWDPLTNSYRMASAQLGSVRVEPDASGKSLSQPSTESEARKLSRELKPRAKLQQFQAGFPALTDSPWYWTGLGLAPLLVVMTGASLRILAGVRRRLAQQKDDLQQQASKALRTAHKAIQAGDSKTALGEVERALFLGVEGATGLKARGMLRDELSVRLRELGCDDQLISTLASLLEHCETARFTGTDADTNAAQIASQARQVNATLARQARGKKSATKS